MRKNSLAALIAGFGTGYLNAESRKREDARQKKMDDRAETEWNQKQEDRATQKKMESEVISDLDSASKMKVGELRTEDGLFDNSIEAWENRIATTPDANGQMPSADVVKKIAPIYMQAASRKGAEKWLSSDAPDAIFGKVRQTTRGDIARSQANAISKLGISAIPQAMSLQEKADSLDIKDLQTKILSAQSIDDLNDYYKIFPDGYDLKGDINKDTGRLSYWYEKEDGSKVFPDKAMPQDFSNFDELKQFASAFVSGNPEYIMSQYENSRKAKREDKKDLSNEKVTDAQLEEHAQKIKKGEIELASLPESIQLDLKAKKANIAQSFAAIEKSRRGDDEDLTFSDWKKKPENKDKGRDDYAKEKASWGKSSDTDMQTVTEEPVLDPMGRVRLDKDGNPMMTRKVTRKEPIISAPAAKKPAPKNRPPLSSFGK